LVVDAVAHAQHLDGADARAREAQDVGRQDGLGGPGHVTGRDLADELRDVDVRGTGFDARSVEAIDAPIGLGDGLRGSVGRLQVRDLTLEAIPGQLLQVPRLAHWGGPSWRG